MAKKYKTNQTLIDTGFGQTSGDTFTFHSSNIISDDATFRYRSDMSGTYVARSIPDVAFVTGQTGSGGGIGWSNLTNGSTVAGCGTVAYSGAICNNTIYGVDAGANITTGNNNVAIGHQALNRNIVGNGNVAVGICAGYNETTSNKLHIANCANYDLIYGDFINNFVQVPKLRICCIPPSGAYTNSVLSWNPTDCCVKIVPYYSAATLTFNNGLSELGNVVSLGGTLNTNTNICGADYNLTLGDTNSKISNLNINSSCINLFSSGATFSDISAINKQGIKYANDYSLTYVNRSLVDKQYVDTVATGLQIHAAALVATTTNIGLSGLTTIDGITITGGTRVLVKNQAVAWENGLYNANVNIWTRSSDYDFSIATDISNGDLIPVISGNTNKSTLWVLTTPDPVVSGNSLTFSPFSQPINISAGSGIDIGTVGGSKTVCVNLANNSGLCLTPTQLEINPTIAGSGLTYNSGVLHVNVSQTPIIGNAVSVKFCTGCGLAIDSSDIDIGWSNQTNGSTVIGCGTVPYSGTICQNTFYGVDAGKSITTGFANIAIGTHALFGNISGSSNTAIGSYSLSCNINAYGNIGIGESTLFYNSSGEGNVGIGVTTLFNNISGNYNTANGYAALSSNVSGSFNVVNGALTLLSNTLGNCNTVIGSYAGYSNVTGNSNVFLGSCAGYNETTSNKLHIANSATCNLIYGDFLNNFVQVPKLKICCTPPTGTYTNSVLTWNATDCCVKILPYSSGGTIVGGSGIGWSNLTNGSTVAGCGTVPSGGTIYQNTFYGVEAGKSITTGFANVAIGYQALSGNTTGCYNIANGYQALHSNISGNFNIANGINALLSNTCGNNNIAIGTDTLYYNTIGDNNFAFGSSALSNNKSGSFNIANGALALYYNESGSSNIAFGGYSLFKNITGRGNIALGEASLCGNIDGYGNVAIGSVVMTENTSGIGNVAIGDNALGYNISGSSNIAIGSYALFVNGNNNNNIAIGYAAGFSETNSNRLHIGSGFGDSLIYGEFDNLLVKVCGCLRVSSIAPKTSETTIAYFRSDGTLLSGTSTAGSGSGIGWSNLTNGSTVAGCGTVASGGTIICNTFYGVNAGKCITTGLGNIGIGFETLYYNNVGDYNVANGYQALTYNTSGSSNIANGALALFNNTIGNNNIANGYAALSNNTIGNDNIANGYSSLLYNIDGCNNIAHGGYSLTNNTCGNNNIATGFQSLQCNIIGSNNIAFGNSTMRLNSKGNYNIAIGSQTLYSNISGNTNIAIGLSSLYYNTKGCHNIASGYFSLMNNISGCYNIANGNDALLNNTIGSCNIAIGFGSLLCNTIGSNNIGVGNDALSHNIIGANNIANGNFSLFRNESGSANVSIGLCAGYNNITGSSNVLIGRCAGFNETTSNKLHIANCDTCDLIYGDFVNNFVQVPKLKICCTPPTGAYSNCVLTWNTTDCCVKIVPYYSANTSSYGLVTGATNGLYLAHKKMGLGGALTGNTKISGAYSLTFDNSIINLTGTTSVNIKTPAVKLITTPATGLYSDNILVWNSTDKCIKTVSNGVLGNITGVTNGLYLANKKVGLGGSLTGNTKISGAYTMTFSNSIINLTGTTSINLKSPVLTLQSTPATGLSSDSLLVWNSTDKCVKIISNSATLNSAITGATNGLTKSGQLVRLGGTLTGNTTIGGAYALTLNNSIVNLTGTTSINLRTPVLTLQTTPATGLYSDNILVWNSTDKCVKVVNSCVLGNITGVTNGLYLANKKVGLGGTLTGNTTIGGNYTLNISNGAKLSTQCGYQISGATIFDVTRNSLSNIRIGQNALVSNTTGINNIAIGRESLNKNTCGSSNIANGYQSLYSNISGSSNIAIGNCALYCNIKASQNIAIGNSAQQNNTLGIDNIAIGNNALLNNKSGCTNTAIGINSLYNNTIGNYNFGVGFYSLYCNTSGCYNFAIGNQSLYYNTIGCFNSALGHNTLYNNRYGCFNVADGYSAMYCNIAGCNNVAIGASVMSCNTSGSTNVAIGISAGFRNVTGNSNIFLGSCAGYNETTSNKLHIANSITCDLIYGDFVNNFVQVPKLKICCTPPTGTYTNSVLTWNATDCCVKIVPYYSANTSSYGLITGATNGLYLANKKVGLGGALTGNTRVSGAYTMTFSNSIVNLTGTTSINLRTPVLTLQTTPATGLYSDNILVWNSTDKCVKVISNSLLGNVTGTTNGLYLANKKVGLGGALTGNTRVSGAYTMTFSNSIINLTGTTSINLKTPVLTLQTTPATGLSSDNILVWNSTDKCVKVISNSLLGNVTGTTNGLYLANKKIGLGGTLTGNTTINTAGYSLNITKGFLSTETGYRISGTTILDVTRNSLTNIRIGQNALISNTTGIHNISIGVQSLNKNTTGCYNVGVGYNTLYCNTCGNYNVGIGYQSLYSNTSGTTNIAIGLSSLYYNTIGCHNIASGYFSLNNNLSGNYNIANGNNALLNNTVGSCNTAIGFSALLCNTTGGNNIGIGTDALSRNTIGNNNITNGYRSLYSNKSGSTNIAIGFSAGYSNISGSSNVYIGGCAGYNETTSNKLHIANYATCDLIYGDFLNNFIQVPKLKICCTPPTGFYTNNVLTWNATDCCIKILPYSSGGTTTGSGIGWSNRTNGSTVAGCGTVASGGTICNNTFYGVCVGSSITTGSGNVAIGSDSFRNNTIGNCNIAIGGQSLINNLNGGGNIAVGFQSLSSNVSGYTNIAIGLLSLKNNIDGHGNIAIGCNTLLSNITGSNNTAIGTDALQHNTTGFNNIGVGFQSIFNNICGFSNVSIGNSALSSNSCGYVNIAIGDSALYSNTCGYGNIAVGNGALYFNNSGNTNISIGSQALYDNTYGCCNIAIGECALTNNICGIGNIAIGYRALFSNTTGCYNIANGVESLYSNTIGKENIANGVAALYSNTCGDCNIANGTESLYCNTSGSYNIANGGATLFYNTTGCNNIATGQQALYSNTCGIYNIASSREALYNNTCGCYNIALGYSALYWNTTGCNNIAIGVNSGTDTLGNITTQCNQVVIGNDLTTNAIVKVAWTIGSDERDKTNFDAVPHGLTFVENLKPISYQFRECRESNIPSGGIRYGFKAQNILALEGDNPIIINNNNPDHLLYNESSLIPVLVKSIQELSCEVKDLKLKLCTMI